MNWPRKDRSLNEPITYLDQRYIDCDYDAQKAWATLGNDEMDFIIGEIRKCMNDIEYYLANYHFIRKKDGLSSVETIYPMWESQTIILDKFKQQYAENKPVRLIILKSRQLGCTTLSTSILCWYVFFFPNRQMLSMSDEYDKVSANFNMCRTAYSSLPWWMKPEKRYDRADTLLGFDRTRDDSKSNILGLDSRIFFEAANKPSGAAYSKALNGVHLAEIGRYKQPKPITEGVFGSLIGAPRSFGILEGTPQGRGTLFHTLWQQATKGDFWEPIFIEWFREPGYRMTVPEGFQLTSDELAKRTKVETETGYLLDDEQMYWYRRKAEEFRAAGDLDTLSQEFCVAGDTFVSCEDGIIPISKAAVRTPSKCESGEILHVIEKSPSQTYRLLTKDGRCLHATGIHPVAMWDGGFKNLAELKAGDKILLCPPMFSEHSKKLEIKLAPTVSTSIDVSEDFAVLSGYYMANGYSDLHKAEVAINATDTDVCEYIEQMWCKYVSDKLYTHTVHHSNAAGCYIIESGGISVQVLAWCYEWQSRPSMKKSVHVPTYIMESPRHIVAAFLRGLFEGDGSASSNCVRFYTKNNKFAREIQLLLLGFGINARISSERKDVGKAIYYGYTINLTREQSLLFRDHIGFIGERKNKLASVFTHPLFSRRTNELVDEVFRVSIADIIPTYDFTVHGHVFSANGILTHNSNFPAEAWLASGETVFPKDAVMQQSVSFVKPPKWRGEIGLLADDTPSSVATPNGWLKIWEMPKHGENYIIGADISLGLETGDYSAAQVLRVPADVTKPLIQCAVAHCKITPQEFARALCALGYMYNKALIVPEVNQLNSVAIDLTERLMYPNVYRMINEHSSRKGVSPYFGWMTTARNKNAIVALMRSLLLHVEIVIRDEATIEEMLDFAKKDPLGLQYGAISKDGHDDLVMSLCITAYVAANSWGRVIEFANPLIETTRSATKKNLQAVDEDDEAEEYYGTVTGTTFDML